MMMKALNILILTIILANAEAFDQRIVGGEPAPAGRFPFYAKYYSTSTCGSALIHSDIVLGAAHCCAPRQCGLLFDSIDFWTGTLAIVEKYIRHPQYERSTLANDVLIMKLTTPLDINPIGCNTQHKVPVNRQNLTAIGFGALSTGGSMSDDLMQVTVNYVPNEECNQAYNGRVLDNMMCAAAPYKDSCQGDSGGPLLTADDGTGKIAGIVSWGSGCARPEYPGVYARVSEYEEWIQEAICCMSDDPPDSCESYDCSPEFGSVYHCGTPVGNMCGRPGPIVESINGITSSDSSDFCLSPDATALVERKGKVSIKDVAVGDKVMTASGKYKTVFTISHSHPDQLTSFLSVQTEMKENPLELTSLHMLFLQGKRNPIPAKDVKIGDVVQTLYHGPQKVTKVTVVTRNGFYNPVTMDGTIVVDGIITSTYTSLNGGSYLEIANTKWISFQLLFNIIASPFSVFCTTVSLDLCTQYQPRAVHSMKKFYGFLLKQNIAGQLFLLFVFLSFFGLAHTILSPVGILAVLAFVGMIYHFLSSKLPALHHKRMYYKEVNNRASGVVGLSAANKN